VATVRSCGGATAAGSGGSTTQPGMGVWLTPRTGSQASAVHAFPSLQLIGSNTQVPVAGLQLSLVHLFWS